jgi:hypothetical protein
MIGMRIELTGEAGQHRIPKPKYRKQPHAKYRAIDALSDPAKTF